MDRRLEFHEVLVTLLGSRNVYFQPATNVRMVYPCFKYELDDIFDEHADNFAYRRTKRYQVTYIDTEPDSVIPDMVATLPMSSFERAYPADDLNHTVYNVYF